MLVVAIHVFYAYHNGVVRLGQTASFVHHNRAITHEKLDTMVCYAQTYCETESVAKPIDSLIYVFVAKHGNDSALGDRAICQECV